MKKYLKFLIFIALILIPIKVNASYINVYLTCPAGASAGQTVNCTISTTNSGDIGSVMISYSFGGGASYNTFTASGSFGLYNPKTTGVQLGQPGGTITSNGNLGVLAVTIPASATPGSSVSVGLTGINASTTSYDDITAANVSKSIAIYSNNNYLSSLSISGAAISFNKNTHSYTVNIDAASTTISATVEDSRATVSGVGAKSLREGKNTFYVVVTAQNGGQRTYTIVINRPYSQQPTPTPQPTPEPETPTEEPTEPTDPDAPELPLGGIHEIEGPNAPEKDGNTKLKTLTIDKIAIPFDPSIVEYELNVDFDIDSIKIKADAESDKAKVDGATTHKLIVGRNVIRVTVTAEDGKVRIYEIIINRDKEESANKKNKLQKLEIEGHELVFNADQNTYTIQTSENSLNIDVVLASDNSTYSIKGNSNLIDGSVIRIKVADEDGNINVYEIKVEKVEKKEEKESNLGIIILIIVLSLFGGIGTGLAIVFYIKSKNSSKAPKNNIELPKVKEEIKPKVEEHKHHEHHQVHHHIERLDEPEILMMTGEIKPVAEPVKKD